MPYKVSGVVEFYVVSASDEAAAREMVVDDLIRMISVGDYVYHLQIPSPLDVESIESIPEPPEVPSSEGA
ncbi:MAG: hypothetical protein ABWY93_18670 [Mycobacterium sp.]